MIILPQSAKICLDNLLYFYFFERSLIKPSLDDLILESIVVLSPKNEKVSLFIRAISTLVNKVMSFESRNRFTFGV